jgi:hypothetical protein
LLLPSLRSDSPVSWGLQPMWIRRQLGAPPLQKLASAEEGNAELRNRSRRVIHECKIFRLVHNAGICISGKLEIIACTFHRKCASHISGSASQEAQPGGRCVAQGNPLRVHPRVFERDTFCLGTLGSKKDLGTT